MNSPLIAVIEDEEHLAQGLIFNLRAEGYSTWHEADGAAALAWLLSPDSHPAAILLDVMLPGADGFTITRTLREARRYVPILLLTARGRTEDVVEGFEAGADDYLAKPFEVSELEARIRAQLRRSSGQAGTLLRCGDLGFDTVTRGFTLKGAALPLTPRESAVLEQLIRRSGRAFSKVALAETVFGFDDDADPSAIEIYVHRLRKKLDGSSVSIATLRGLGYLLRHDAA